MVKGKRIVAVVDSRLGADQTSMRRANWLAQQQQAGIELLLCLGDEHLSGEVYEDTTTLEKARERTTAHHQHQLKQLALDFGNQDIDVMTTVVWDTPLDDAITRHVLNSEPSLVIKETQHPSRVSQAFLSDTDWGLIGKCPAPLLLAKSNGWTMGAPVMAAIDPMFASHRTAMMDTEILCTAKKYAHISGSDMFAMHCFSPSYHGLAMPSYAYDGYQQRRRSLEAVHRESVVSFMSTHGFGNTQLYVKAGRPAQCLAKASRELSVGLLVMGSSNQNIMGRAPVGSTTEHLVDKVVCDLLVLKPPWFSTSVR